MISFFHKNIKGLTLVSLVITIIILLILAGLTIIIASNGNLFEKAELATSKTMLTQLKEQVEIMKHELILSKDGNYSITSHELAQKVHNNLIDSSISEYANGNIIVTTADKLYDIIITQDLNVQTLKHSSSLQGTWLLNETITYSNDLYFELDGIVSNTDYSYSFSSIKADYLLGYYYFAPFWTGGNPHHPYGFANIPENSLGVSSGWVWINVETYENTTTSGVKLTINSDISEVTDENGNFAGEELLSWLQSNAVKQ